MDCTRRELNIANRAKRMAETFGRSNNFATLSLSLSLSYIYICSNSQPHLTIKDCGHSPEGAI